MGAGGMGRGGGAPLSPAVRMMRASTRPFSKGRDAIKTALRVGQDDRYTDCKVKYRYKYWERNNTDGKVVQSPLVKVSVKLEPGEGVEEKTVSCWIVLEKETLHGNYVKGILKELQEEAPEIKRFSQKISEKLKNKRFRRPIKGSTETELDRDCAKLTYYFCNCVKLLHLYHVNEKKHPRGAYISLVKVHCSPAEDMSKGGSSSSFRSIVKSLDSYEPSDFRSFFRTPHRKLFQKVLQDKAGPGVFLRYKYENMFINDENVHRLLDTVPPKYGFPEWWALDTAAIAPTDYESFDSRFGKLRTAD